jgi:hypothetical protein
MGLTVLAPGTLEPLAVQRGSLPRVLLGVQVTPVREVAAGARRLVVAVGEALQGVAVVLVAVQAAVEVPA